MDLRGSLWLVLRGERASSGTVLGRLEGLLGANGFSLARDDPGGGNLLAVAVEVLTPEARRDCARVLPVVERREAPAVP